MVCQPLTKILRLLRFSLDRSTLKLKSTHFFSDNRRNQNFVLYSPDPPVQVHSEGLGMRLDIPRVGVEDKVHLVRELGEEVCSVLLQEVIIRERAAAQLGHLL